MRRGGRARRARDRSILRECDHDPRVIGPGAAAPDFELPDQDGELVRLSSLRGQRVVLFFYPRAGTRGCTAQACSVRDRGDEYAAAGARVIGVSPDPVRRIKRFHDEHGLGFTLLSDADHAVCESYGVWVQKSLYGRTYMGAQRATLIVREDGIVAHTIPKVSPSTHDDRVLKALAELAAPD